MSFDLTVYLCRNQVSTELFVFANVWYWMEWNKFKIFLGYLFSEVFLFLFFYFLFLFSVDKQLSVCVCVSIYKEREREREHGLKSLEVLQHTVQTYI